MRGETSSVPITLRTHNEPGEILPQDIGSDWITIMWRSPDDDSVQRHAFMYIEVRAEEW